MLLLVAFKSLWVFIFALASKCFVIINRYLIFPPTLYQYLKGLFITLVALHPWTTLDCKYVENGF